MYLSCGHYRGRIQTTTMRVFETLADAWAYALRFEVVAGCPMARIWKVSEAQQAVLLKPIEIQTALGLPLTVKDWM